MKKTVLVFGASSSRHSINKKLATYAANQLEGVQLKLLDLNDFEMPIYSIDKEKEQGIPDLAQQFKQHIKEADGILISFAEHNGSYSAAYKNIYDWISRMGGKVWEDKPMFLLATSPGGRGAKGVLAHALNSYQRSTESLIVDFSLPSFSQNFDETQGIQTQELHEEFRAQLSKFKQAL